ncbi:Nucleolin [Fukomys damarensis]|uniref:Nucleolin n=1 Tax=Fukomys damarensis TaxID=885580 RepID=A0A091CR25_FUKDA|nr:Nucleolin [Fukomys damarensis]
MQEHFWPKISFTIKSIKRSDELKKVFKDALEIRLSKGGKSKGIAYIEFKTKVDAEKNFEEKHGGAIDERSVYLYMGGERLKARLQKCEEQHLECESKTLYLNHMSCSTTEETLQEVLEKATFIQASQNQNDKSKGYPFIEFTSFEDSKEALNSFNKSEIEGRPIRIELQGPRGLPNARRQPSKTLFVNVLSEETTGDLKGII